MVARPEELVQRLYSNDSTTKFKAVREVKNQIIGNKSKKLSYIKLGAVPRVVQLLASEGEPNSLKVQSAAAVGSFAYGVDDGLRAVVESGGVASLVKALYSTDEKVVEAAVRSLKMIYQSANVPTSNVLNSEGIERLVSLLAAPNHAVAESAAVLLARAVAATSQASVVANAGGVDGLVSMLLQGDATSKEAAVEALASLAAADDAVAGRIAAQQQAVSVMLQLLKDGKARCRYMACACLTAVSKFLPDKPEQQDCSIGHVQQSVLPVLVKLLGEGEVREEVPSTLFRLICDSEALQRAASDADAISKLAAFLHDEHCSAKLKEGTLRALGTLCMPLNREDSRKQLLEAKVLTPIVKSLQDPSASIRAAGCSCLRSLSRSVKHLHSNLINAEVALQLLRLLGDTDYDVQSMASAALTNMVLHFSPAKEVVLKENGIAQLAMLVHSMDSVLRLNGVWALQNLLYGPETDLRRSVMAHVPWADVKALLEDEESSIQEKALCLLRNLLYDSPKVIDAVLAWSGNELLNIVQHKLDPSRACSTTTRLHALYIVVNTAAGNDAQKEFIMASGVPGLFPHYLQSPDKDVRLAVLWVIINLTFSAKDGSDAAAAAGRVVRLQELQVQQALQELQHDEDLDVKERVKTVMDQFRGAGHPI